MGSELRRLPDDCEAVREPVLRALDDTRYGDNPTVIRYLAREGAREAARDLMGQPASHPIHNRGHRDHQRWVDWMKFYSKISS